MTNNTAQKPLTRPSCWTLSTTALEVIYLDGVAGILIEGLRYAAGGAVAPDAKVQLAPSRFHLNVPWSLSSSSTLDTSLHPQSSPGATPSKWLGVLVLRPHLLMIWISRHHRSRFRGLSSCRHCLMAICSPVSCRESTHRKDQHNQWPTTEKLMAQIGNCLPRAPSMDLDHLPAPGAHLSICTCW